MVFLPLVLKAVFCASMLEGDGAYPRSVVNDHCPAGVWVVSWGGGRKDSYAAAIEKQKIKWHCSLVSFFSHQWGVLI